MGAVKVEELEARFKYYSTLFPIVGGFIDRLPLITESNKIRNISEFKSQCLCSMVEVLEV